MSKAKIYDLLAQMAVVFGKAETKERLQYYAVELSEYNFETVKAALRAHAKTKTFFPSLAEIIEAIAKIESQELDATETAQRLIDATYKFGEYQANIAREDLGDLWGIVERWGGWRQLCNFPESQKQTVRAQLRDLILDLNRKAKNQIAFAGIPQLESKNELKALDFSEFRRNEATNKNEVERAIISAHDSLF